MINYIQKDGSNRIVRIYENEVYKIPKDIESVWQNQLEFEIWNKTNSKYLCKCRLDDNIFLWMDKIEKDISKNDYRIIDNLPEDLKYLLEKYKKLEYGIDKNGNYKIYDYADFEKYDEEYLFIEDLNKLNN